MAVQKSIIKVKILQNGHSFLWSSHVVCTTFLENKFLQASIEFNISHSHNSPGIYLLHRLRDHLGRTMIQQSYRQLCQHSQSMMQAYITLEHKEPFFPSVSYISRENNYFDSPVGRQENSREMYFFFPSLLLEASFSVLTSFVIHMKQSSQNIS